MPSNSGKKRKRGAWCVCVCVLCACVCMWCVCVCVCVLCRVCVVFLCVYARRLTERPSFLEVQARVPMQNQSVYVLDLAQNGRGRAPGGGRRPQTAETMTTRRATAKAFQPRPPPLGMRNQAPRPPPTRNLRPPPPRMSPIPRTSKAASPCMTTPRRRGSPSTRSMQHN
jgi:hypothetical protein